MAADACGFGKPPPGGSSGNDGGSAALVVRMSTPPPGKAGAEAGNGASNNESRRPAMTDGALQLQLGRMVELVMGKEVGPANVRRWLQVRG
jgi:hypothetical protein